MSVAAQTEAYRPQQRLNFCPLPQRHGSFRPGNRVAVGAPSPAIRAADSLSDSGLGFFWDGSGAASALSGTSVSGSGMMAAFSEKR